jgi:hypothetical protein
VRQGPKSRGFQTVVRGPEGVREGYDEGPRERFEKFTFDFKKQRLMVPIGY